MTAATLDASVTRLESIKGKEGAPYNKEKIAEAEALAAEALRMANEAKLAAGRLAEVKKTLSMFSNKLEKAEQSVQKDAVKALPSTEESTGEAVYTGDVVEKPDDSKAAVVVDTAAAEETVDDPEYKEDPPQSPTALADTTTTDDDVFNFTAIELPTTKNTPATIRKVPAVATPPPPREHDFVEDLLDGLGVDKMCGVDDETLGFTDRPKIVAPEPVFENPTRIKYTTLSNREYLHETSAKEKHAALQREKLEPTPMQYQRANVNTEFADPFGVDHDDLVLCGKIADTCDPPEELYYQKN